MSVVFFPNRVTLEFDILAYTPLMVDRIMVAATEARSIKKAPIAMKHVGGQSVLFKTIQQITCDVGSELDMRRDAAFPSQLNPCPQFSKTRRIWL